MKRARHLFSTLLLLLGATVAPAQQWTVIELPAKIADMPQLVQDRFGCTYQELSEKYNLTHVRFTGTDFNRNDSDNEGRLALQALLNKAKVVDLSQVTDNEETIEYYKKNYFDFEANYPGPGMLYSRVSWGGCDSIEHFIFPKTLTIISSNSMAGMEKLKQVTWPDKVKHLAWRMFVDCTSLEHIALPDSLDGVPEGCFDGCTALKSVTLTPVNIGKEAFRACSSLEQITIPEGVEVIGDNCFIRCSALKEVNLPSTITTIGARAFEDCDQLKGINLPQQLKTIAYRTFAACDSLESIVVPDSVVSIGESVFYDCSSLKQVTLPAGLSSIGNSAFGQSGLEQIDMPDNVTELGEESFENCSYLKRVHLSRQLTTIPRLAFSGCELLEEINIPHRITRIEESAFAYCKQLSSLVLQEGVTHLGKDVFFNSHIQHITLPKSLQYIGRGCFSYSRLQNIFIPEGVVDIGESAFANCDSLSHVTLSNGLLYLGNSAFSYCTMLEDVTFPTTLRYMGGSVFYNNKRKKSYTQPPLINIVPDGTCIGCDSLMSITLHGRVTEIGPNAFLYCNQLSHVNLPDGLQTIGDYAFRECGLTELNIPSTVRFINREAFAHGSYKRVVLPEGVECIGYCAFYSDSLRYVDFPSTVRTLGDNAFQGGGPVCDSIVLRALLPPQNTGALHSRWDEATLYVPAATIDAYLQNEGFANCFSSIKPLNDDTSRHLIVASAYSTDSIWFPTIADADLTITYNPDWNNGYQSGHLHVGKEISWPINHLRIDYHNNWRNFDEYTGASTLINEGSMSAQSMEMNLVFDPNEWFFFTPPFDMKASDLQCSDAHTPYIIRTFDGAQRAAGNHYLVWTKVEANDMLRTGQGYIMQYGGYAQQTGAESWNKQTPQASFHMQPSTPLVSNILASDEVAIPLVDYKSEFPHNAGWNLVANPYLAYFNIQQIDSDSPILVSKAAPYQAFEAVSPIDDQFVLPPLYAFLIQKGIAQNAITFHPEGRQDGNSLIATSNSRRALRRQELRRQRAVYDVMLQRHTETESDSLLARTRIVVTPRATEQYDRGQDAPFIAFDDQATVLYSRTAGLRYCFNELPPTTTSVALGTHLAEAGSYTLSMTARGHGTASVDTPSHLWLTDRETGTQTDLLTDSYTFSVSEPGTLNNRFVLQLSDGINAVPCVEASSQQSERLYDLQGRSIGTPAKGIYIKGHKKYIK